MKTCVLFLTLSFLSFASWAMTPMEQHMLSVSQGMSAFYMYLLSDGDEKYLRQFKQYQKSARSTFRNVSKEDYKRFSIAWQALGSKLQYGQINEGGLFFDGRSRTEYRNYLTKLYLHFEEYNDATTLDFNSATTRIQLLTSVLAARSLDVVSADYGAMGLTEYDIKLDPEAVAQQVTEDLDLLLGKNLSKNHMRVVRKVNSKFRFIKNTMVDYKAETAYFLIYRNVKSMNKLLAKESNQLVASNTK